MNISIIIDTGVYSAKTQSRGRRRLIQTTNAESGDSPAFTTSEHSSRAISHDQHLSSPTTGLKPPTYEEVLDEGLPSYTEAVFMGEDALAPSSIRT